MGEMSWFYNMLITSGCIPEDASQATAWMAVIITFSTLQVLKWLLSPKR